jgi:hypothetical protein
MISPNWTVREQLSQDIRTRFRLRLSFPDEHGYAAQCAQMRSLHPSVIFALRKIKSISLLFETKTLPVQEINFRKVTDSQRGTLKITAKNGAEAVDHVYRTLAANVPNMPRQDGRSQTKSLIQIGLPVTNHIDPLPKVDVEGQFVFAFLPVVQMTQLPFLVQADFILTGGRQAVIDNAWNRALRTGLVHLFRMFIAQLVTEQKKLSYRWLTYLPLQPMLLFWQTFPKDIQQKVTAERFYLSRNQKLLRPRELRILAPYFTHLCEPLVTEDSSLWSFLSPDFPAETHSTLIKLSVGRLQHEEALGLFSKDLSRESAALYSRPLKDAWHDTFLKFISAGLANGRRSTRDIIFSMAIVPLRVQNQLEWRQFGTRIFFPYAVNEGMGSECVKIAIPSDADLAVLHPDALVADDRREKYSAPGVTDPTPSTICTAVLAAMSRSVDKYASDLIASLEILFWYAQPLSLTAQADLKALNAVGFWSSTAKLFMRSKERGHAETLISLEGNPLYQEHFLHDDYQTSTVATRFRGGRTWNQWLTDIAGIRWYPPLADIDDRNQLHWCLEIVREQNSREFLFVIQQYWAQEYSATCQFKASITVALRKAQVLCQHEGRTELQQTWFPSAELTTVARKYGVESLLPILSLPDTTNGLTISTWPALIELGVRSSINLSFYRGLLRLLSVSGAPPIVGTVKMGWLYDNMAQAMTLEDRAVVQVPSHPIHTTGLILHRPSLRRHQ